MTDLVVSSSYIEQIAERTRRASDALSLPSSVLSADAGVVQSTSVSDALHESSAERGLRAGLVAQALEQLASNASETARTMSTTDSNLAREAV